MLAPREELDLRNEVLSLKEEVKDLRMRLSAIKIIVTRIEPICSEKFTTLLESCEGCKGEEEVKEYEGVKSQYSLLCPYRLPPPVGDFYFTERYPIHIHIQQEFS